jgi:hypothetical protein
MAAGKLREQEQAGGRGDQKQTEEDRKENPAQFCNSFLTGMTRIRHTSSRGWPV